MGKIPVSLPLTVAPNRTSPSRRSRFHILALPLVLSIAALVHLVRPHLRFGYDTCSHSQTTAGVFEESVREGTWNQFDHDGQPPRVAIIGAGAGGSSAAYFLKHFSNLTSRNLTTEVTVYERSPYIGGRSTVLWPWVQDGQDPYLSPTTGPDVDEDPIELGASIFVAANKNLNKAVKEFNLVATAYGQDEDGDTGVWDGEQFVFKESGRGWWDKTKLLWRYGRSPFKVKALVETTVASFVSLYTREFIASASFPFTSIANFSTAVNLLTPASVSGSEYLAYSSVAPLFTNELVSAATQVNYGTPIDEIHGVGALVSLAANGAVSVKGGNRQIFEQFATRSEAKLQLDTTVKEIVQLDGDGTAASSRRKWLIKTESGQGGGVYDAVILAAPFHQTGISVPQLEHKFSPQPYVPLQVTIVLTNASTPLASYFSLPPKTTVPTSIFSTFSTESNSKARFNSLNYLKPLPASIGIRFDPTNSSTVHVVKLFSKELLSEIELEAIFGTNNVLRTINKTWFAYPRLDPIVNPRKDLSPIRVSDDGFYYINAFERLISTMETETVSAYNVVSLVLRDLFGYKPPTSWAEWDLHKH
ncbi:uncharacterized protein JCM15063_000100 [Sporobolomyces koalae]|uniref:uncharacterized protein n=1 Tax=Sporobolomyces koalae TaxID=500713 RepID=UPI003171B5AB